MASADLLDALELIEATKTTNVSDWSGTVLSTLYTQAINTNKNKNAGTVCHLTMMCKSPKMTMVSTLPELGTFLKPTPKQAIPKCTPSHFGRGVELVYDEAVRKSVEHKLQTRNIQIKQGKDQEKEQEEEEEAINYQIRHIAELAAVRLFGPLVKLTPDKVVIYSPGGKFDTHRDSIASVDHIGTVVVQLPVHYSGGQLLFNNVEGEIAGKNYKVNFVDSDNSDESDDDYFYYGDNNWHCDPFPKLVASAFYTDVEHNVSAVTSGHRVTVTFKVEKSTDPINLTSLGLGMKIERPRTPTNISAYNLGYNLECDTGYSPCDGVESDDEDDSYLHDVQLYLRNRYSAVDLQPFIHCLETVYKNAPIIIGCRHMIPRAALNIQGLRGVDKIVAEKLAAAGYTVKPVLVTVDKIYGMEDKGANYNHIFVCDVPDEARRPIFIRPSDDYEAIVLQSGKKYLQHIGNEPGEVDALHYISAALLVAKNS